MSLFSYIKHISMNPHVVVCNMFVVRVYTTGPLELTCTLESMLTATSPFSHFWLMMLVRLSWQNMTVFVDFLTGFQMHWMLSTVNYTHWVHLFRRTTCMYSRERSVQSFRFTATIKAFVYFPLFHGASSDISMLCHCTRIYVLNVYIDIWRTVKTFIYVVQCL